MENDINTLMARVDEINLQSPPYTADDIDVIIRYHRRARSMKAAGIKPDKPKIDLDAIMSNILPKAKPSGIRRL